MPALLTTGGETDVWPDTTLVLVDVEATTASLEAGLFGDGNDVARCRHEEGHYVVPSDLLALTHDFLLAQTFGQPSPYADGSGLTSQCWVSDGTPR